MQVMFNNRSTVTSLLTYQQIEYGYYNGETKQLLILHKANVTKY